MYTYMYLFMCVCLYVRMYLYMYICLLDKGLYIVQLWLNIKFGLNIFQHSRKNILWGSALGLQPLLKPSPS